MTIKEEGSPTDLGSVWSKYGLRESPFITAATRLLGVLPIEKVFSGRQEETKRICRILTSSNSTRTLILGDFGVGKTTFVNYIKWILALKDKTGCEFVTVPSEIKIQPDWSSMDFLLSTLTSIYNASIIFKWEKAGLRLGSLDQIKDYVTIGTQRGFQGGVSLISGGYSETKSIPSSIGPEIYERLLTDFCLELREEGKQIIISYDNMENIQIDKLSDLFRTIKDYIQIEGLHTIFIGPPNCLSALEKYPQAHSVFTQPTILEPLTDENVLDILKKRCEALKFKDGDYIIPYEDRAVREIYKRLNNIRFTFKILEDTTLFTENKAPCRITMTEIQAVQAREKEEILSKLAKPELRIVSCLIDLQGERINLSRLSKITQIGATNLRNPLSELENKGLIVINPSEEDRRIKFVRLSDNSYLRVFFASEKI